ncbi:kinesin motor protein cin8, partial [Tulasnella sp. 417]
MTPYITARLPRVRRVIQPYFQSHRDNPLRHASQSVTIFGSQNKQPFSVMPARGLTPNRRNLDPEAETDSIVQPGRKLRVPPELPGTLEMTGGLLGSTSFATTCKGVLTSPGGEERTVVIKRVNLLRQYCNWHQFRTRIKLESVIWTTVAHPNILPFIGYQIVENHPILVSPWCQNGNISNYILSNPGITRNGKIELLCHAARGLIHMHNLDPQIAHGNIKPENVIVQDNLVAALCDFGIEQIYDEQDRDTMWTTRGKPVYQAKEFLVADHATPSPATDVYSFGGLILAIMSGRPPFWNRNADGTLLAVIQDKTPTPKDHPQLPADDPLWNLLRASWSGEPERRPTMSEVLQKLEDEQAADDPAEEMEVPPSPRESIREEESLVRPGYFFKRELPKPITGTLEKDGELAIRGGYGDVYRGSWVRPNAEPVLVVIKCVRPPEGPQDEKFELRVKRETLIWGSVKHRNILPFIGYQIVDNVPMLVSPWCKNGNLEMYTKAHPELNRDTKLELLRGAARGLLYLHSFKPPIFHGDIKPQNIIVRDNLEAALCDFGISRVILKDEEHSGLTTSLVCSGTKGFQPKEILEEGPPTTAADVYAFAGVILATMSGFPPFYNKGANATTIAVAQDKTPDPKLHPKLSETDRLSELRYRALDLLEVLSEALIVTLLDFLVNLSPLNTMATRKPPSTSRIKPTAIAAKPRTQLSRASTIDELSEPASSTISTPKRQPVSFASPTKTIGRNGERKEEMNVQVVVRCRIRSEREIADGSPIIVSTQGARSEEITVETGSATSNMGIYTQAPTKTYPFDRVFGPEADQAMIYNDVVQPILEEVVQGYNCTLFAYGQTGTGKTYTMQGDLTPSVTGGPCADAGMVPRVLSRLYKYLESSVADYSVKLSYVELYNEELRDLLAPEMSAPAGSAQPMGLAGTANGGGLKIFDEAGTGKRGVLIQGLEDTPVKDFNHAIALLRKGSHRRQIASTKFNDHSSRSHSIFTITVHTKETCSKGDEALRVGKLNLVDLAGSENIGRSGAENKRAREAGMINQSLLTLGRVINALVDQSPHVPYRESKLTRLLQDSLGGRTKTCIIAT